MKLDGEQMPTRENTDRLSPLGGSFRVAVGPPPGTMISRFIVLAELGAGGMGVVVSAYDAALDRKVAIKLLRSFPEDEVDGPEQRAARFLREAQAMAKIAHRNVISVYEVGTFEGQVFIAMEHVDGETLAHWLRTPRPLRALLATFAQAARGLAAAHASGLVHRDFKPDNVLCARDGRVLVSDFGVAALAARAAPEPPPSGRAMAHRLTRDGVVVGTPGYIAPEHLAGEDVDARADQYAFCVTLHEALFGERPLSEQPDTAPGPAARHGVPRWLRALVLRGLARRPDDRHPSMAAVADALEHGGRRRRTLLVAGGLVAAATIATVLGLSPTPQPCAGLDAHLAGVWDPEVAARLGEVFAATGRPDARDTFRRVAGALDGYARDWVAMRTDACLATNVRREQSPALLDLRMACLDRRLDAMGALVRVLGGVDREMLTKAAYAASSLPPLDECADAAALTAAVPPPRDPVVRAAVTRLQRRLDDVEALANAGKRLPAYAIAGVCVTEADALGFAPARARALLRLARFQRELGHPSVRQTAHEAALAAAQALDDSTLAASLALDATVLATEGKHDQAEVLRPAALAVAERSRDDRTRARVIHMIGTNLKAAGRLVEAERELAAALALEERAGDHDSLAIVSTLQQLAGVRRKLDRLDEASPLLARALGIVERRLGPDSVMTDTIYYEIGAIALARDDAEGAREAFARMVQIFEGTYGPDHRRVGAPVLALATALVDLGRYDEALADAERALRLARGRTGWTDHDDAWPELVIGKVLRELGRGAEARAHLDKAAALLEPVDVLDATEAWDALAELDLDDGAPAAALERYRRVLASRSALLPPAHARVISATADVGRALLALGRTGEALPLLEEARALEERHAPRVRALRAQVAWGLARALRTGGRARALAVEALEVSATLPDRTTTRERPGIAAFVAATRP